MLIVQYLHEFWNKMNISFKISFLTGFYYWQEIYKSVKLKYKKHIS